MKEQIKQLFSEIRDIRFPSLGEIIIGGGVIIIIAGIALANSIWGIIIAGIMVLILIAGFKNPTY